MKTAELQVVSATTALAADSTSTSPEYLQLRFLVSGGNSDPDKDNEAKAIHASHHSNEENQENRCSNNNQNDRSHTIHQNSIVTTYPTTPTTTFTSRTTDEDDFNWTRIPLSTTNSSSYSCSCSYSTSFYSLEENSLPATMMANHTIATTTKQQDDDSMIRTRTSPPQSSSRIRRLLPDHHHIPHLNHPPSPPHNNNDNTTDLHHFPDEKVGSSSQSHNKMIILVDEDKEHAHVVLSNIEHQLHQCHDPQYNNENKDIHHNDTDATMLRLRLQHWLQVGHERVHILRQEVLFLQTKQQQKQKQKLQSSSSLTDPADLVVSRAALPVAAACRALELLLMQLQRDPQTTTETITRPSTHTEEDTTTTTATATTLLSFGSEVLNVLSCSPYNSYSSSSYNFVRLSALASVFKIIQYTCIMSHPFELLNHNGNNDSDDPSFWVVVEELVQRLVAGIVGIAPSLSLLTSISAESTPLASTSRSCSFSSSTSSFTSTASAAAAPLFAVSSNPPPPPPLPLDLRIQAALALTGLLLLCVSQKPELPQYKQEQTLQRKIMQQHVEPIHTLLISLLSTGAMATTTTNKHATSTASQCVLGLARWAQYQSGTLRPKLMRRRCVILALCQRLKKNSYRNHSNTSNNVENTDSPFSAAMTLARALLDAPPLFQDCHGAGGDLYCVHPRTRTRSIRADEPKSNTDSVASVSSLSSFASTSSHSKKKKSNIIFRHRSLATYSPTTLPPLTCSSGSTTTTATRGPASTHRSFSSCDDALHTVIHDNVQLLARSIVHALLHETNPTIQLELMEILALLVTRNWLPPDRSLADEITNNEKEKAHSYNNHNRHLYSRTSHSIHSCTWSAAAAAAVPVTTRASVKKILYLFASGTWCNDMKDDCVAVRAAALYLEAVRPYETNRVAAIQIVKLLESPWINVRKQIYQSIHDLCFWNVQEAAKLLCQTPLVHSLSLALRHVDPGEEEKEGDFRAAVAICKHLVVKHAETHAIFCSHPDFVAALVTAVTQEPPSTIVRKNRLLVYANVVDTLLHLMLSLPSQVQSFVSHQEQLLPWLVKLASRTCDAELKKRATSATIRLASILLQQQQPQKSSFDITFSSTSSSSLN